MDDMKYCIDIFGNNIYVALCMCKAREVKAIYYLFFQSNDHCETLGIYTGNSHHYNVP